MKQFITFCVQCHDYQHRLCWMLSSIAQQTIRDQITVDVAFMPGNGDPTTEEVIGMFRNHVRIRASEWTDIERYQRRGYIRNRQLKEATTEWILFGDCDMVYHPEYFEKLKSTLTRNHAKAKYMMSAGRMSNDADSANSLVGGYQPYPAIVPAAFETVRSKLKNRECCNIGAGNSQIINLRYAEHGGCYVIENDCGDRDWNKGHEWNTKSDKRFRRRIRDTGGRRRGLPQWFTFNGIHMNHERDQDYGRHIRTQR